MDWDDFENVGEFFLRKKGDKLAGKPAEDDFYGIAYQAGKGYDFSSMQINGFIWQMAATPGTKPRRRTARPKAS